MATLFDTRLLSVINPDSSIEPGALLWWYVAGTATPTNTYTTDALSVANSNPVEADANGRFPAIWLGAGSFKYILTKADGTPEDPIVSQDSYIVPDIAPSFDPALADFLAGDEPLPIANGGTGPSLALPVVNGGTGGTTAADARAGLGLTSADTAEIETGTDDVKYISPLSLAGIRASNAEVIAGTDPAKYISPLTLKAMGAITSNTNGSYFYIGSTLIQLGLQATTNATFDFPIPFPTECTGFYASNANAMGARSDPAYGYPTSLTQYFMGTKASDDGHLTGFPCYFLAIGK